MDIKTPHLRTDTTNATVMMEAGDHLSVAFCGQIVYLSTAQGQLVVRGTGDRISVELA